jgi:hypothetical protein
VEKQYKIVYLVFTVTFTAITEGQSKKDNPEKLAT